MALTTVSSLSEAFSSGMPVTVDEISFAKEKALVALTVGDADGNKDSPMSDASATRGEAVGEDVQAGEAEENSVA